MRMTCASRVGFCTGGLAAAAVSASRDLGELVKAGVYAAVVALHTGLRATQVARSIVGPHSASPWSMHVRGASRDDIEPLLERFHQRKVRPSFMTLGRNGIKKDCSKLPFLLVPTLAPWPPLA